MNRVKLKNIKRTSLCEFYNKTGSNTFDSQMTEDRDETTKKRNFNMTRLSPILRVVVLIFIAAFAFSSVQAQEGPKLIGAFFVKGKVGLKWMKVADASEYIVYRKTADSEFAKLGTTDKTNYFDTKLQAGVVFTYKIAAVVDGNELAGNTKDVKMPAEIDAFSAPKGVGARINDRETAIMILWDKVKGAIAYNISRSTTSGSGFELIGNVSRVSYTDADNLVSGTSYYYIISALNEEFEESDPSEETVIKFGLTEEERVALEAAESTIHLDSIKLELVFEVTEAKGKPLMNPTGIAVNSKGDFYIVDQGNHRIVCTDNAGQVKFVFGSGMESDDREDPPNGAFLIPFAIGIDSKDQVYVSDVSTRDIQIFSSEGKFIKRIKVPEGEKEGLRANGIDVFDDGRILCSDVGNHRILIIDSEGQIQKEYKMGETFLAHYPNGVQIIDDKTFVHTNPIMGQIIISNFEGEEQLHFGGMGTSVGTFGRAVGVNFSDGLYWCTDAMAGTIQAFNLEGEPKIAISTKSFTDESQQLAGPRGIIVKDNIIYVTSERSNKVMGFKYVITKSE